MDFYNQPWFWAGLFTAVASWGGILITQLIRARSDIKLERLKLYESDVFKAHLELHNFTRYGFDLYWPPDDPEKYYIELMQSSHFKSVRDSKVFFTPEIRKLLGVLELQYECLRELDLNPDKPFENFFREDFLDLLRKLSDTTLERTDQILHK